MGDKSVRAILDGEQRRAFMRSLLDDLRALEAMIEHGLIENGVPRIGAEQELFLVDRCMWPAPAAIELLEALGDEHFTTELGLFNLELNLDPLDFGGDCLRKMELQLDSLIGRLRAAANSRELEVVLTGILPTLRTSDLDQRNMTPLARYREMNHAMTAMRGAAYEFHIRGLDELLFKHDSVMVEGCNASFQIHLQVGAEEFPNLYNIAQIVTAPVLAAGANSPLLFGRQLWSETRIALFQQAVDTRSSMRFLRERSPRVTFGEGWVRRSVLELFQEDVARFRALITRDLDEQPMAALERGEVPQLSALRLFNGTVYRWNRPCYGITGGQPHLRIENRVLPAGPSIVDQMANAAFWYGLVSALAIRFDDVTRAMAFEDAKMNFTAAARLGLGAQLTWFGETLPAVKLICERLVPLARQGLAARGIDPVDIERYLGVLERRVGSFHNGSQWLVRSLAQMQSSGSLAERLTALTAAMVVRQRRGSPVAEWEPATLAEGTGGSHEEPRVEQYMTTDLFTVNEEESVDLVANIMEWKRIRHVPVEDHEHRLIGLVSYRSLLRQMASGQWRDRPEPLSVAEIMKRDPVTVRPETSILGAIELMRERQISCLPVVQGDRLLGIITERDLIQMASDLLTEKLKPRSRFPE